MRFSGDLARRVAHLKAVAPKLWAKGAVEIFLTQDAMAPGDLPLPDCAARRLFDRLADLGAVRELTNRDLIGWLHARNLIGTGPRSPRRGAPYTFVTTQRFLVLFDLQSLQDLPDPEQLGDAGLSG